MNRPVLILFLASALVLFGCTSTTPGGSNSTSANLTVALNTSNQTASPSVPAVASAVLCRVASEGQVELFLFDATRYVYELQLDGRPALEMVYVNDTLYVHYSTPPAAGCEWVFLTAADLNSVRELGGIRFMNHTELASRISADYCQSVPLMESVFSVPSKACPIREALLRAQAT